MDIASVVELIQLATTENPRKAQSTQILDQLRVSPDRWSVGLSVFLDTQNETARFFGLSLVRDWMQCELLNSNATAPTTLLARERIRTSLMNWFTEVLKLLASDPTGKRNMNDVVPYYMSSNAVSVVTLSIKFDFPKLWSSPFAELQQLGYSYGLLGIELVTRVLKELEVEVVMFSETRSKAEIAQNTAVKDAMRESTIILDMVNFLCQGAKHALSAQRVDICAACLQCLSELISWIDATLVVQTALPVVYEMWQQCTRSAVRYACCCCFYELAKKGMDPVAKVRLLHAIQLVPLLTQDERIASQLSVGEMDEEESMEAERVAVLVDMLVLELLGCWSKYEDGLAGTSSSSGKSNKSVSPVMTSGDGGDENQDIVTCIAVVVPFLQALLPLMLRCFTHSVLSVSSATLPSCARLVALLRAQQNRAAVLGGLQASGQVVFRAEDYLDPLLSGIYNKSQYPEDFDFEAAAEDELDLDVEAKNEVRKLFVNICRVRPDRCLDLLNAIMSAQPQPFSAAPYPPLEAALRLVHAFSECGPSHNTLLLEGSFPALVRALYDTDIALHPHPQVLLVFFELAHRYIKHLSRDAILRVFQAMLGRRGVLHPHAMVRDRAAYYTHKICESQEGKAANVLESVYPNLSEILTEAASAELSSGFAKKSPVSEQSEMYLCEAVALLTAHFGSNHANSTGTSSTAASGVSPSAAAVTGSELLRGIVDAQLGQMHLALCLFNEQPQLGEALCAALTRRMNALAGLTKGYSARSNPAAIEVFERALGAVVAVAQRLSHQKQLRAKILVYMHRMVACIGARVLPYEEQILPAMLAACDPADADEVVQVLNQLMVEYAVQALPVVDALFLAVVDKYAALSAVLENGGSHTREEAPHLHAERLLLHRQYLLFVQHISTCGCAATLYTPAHLPRLQTILYAVVLQGVSGGAVASDPVVEDTTTSGVKVNPSYLANSDTQDSVPVRKGALTILNGLITQWLLLPSGLAPSPALISTSPGSIATVQSPPVSPPAEIAQAFRAYLLDSALPRVMHTLSAWTARLQGKVSGADRSQVNVKDAAAQGVLIEAAVLLRSVHILLNANSANPAESGAYFLGMLRSLQWPDHQIQLLVQHLSAATPLGTFKDAFKLFIRECSN